MSTRLFKLAIVFSLISSVFLVTIKSYAQDLDDQAPVVRAVLFYSTTCGHCHKVITEDLPPLFEKYGDQIQIIGINVATEEGQVLYQTYIELWKIPKERQGVPALVIADIELVGSAEIPQLLPGIIEEGLKSGGIDWPEIPGLSEILEQVDNEEETQANDDNAPTNTPEEQQVDSTLSPAPITDGTLTDPVDESLVQSTETSEPTEAPTAIPNQSESTKEILGNEKTAPAASTDLTIGFDDDFTVADRFRQDLKGNSVAVIVLVAMIVSVIWILMTVIRTTTKEGRDWSWVIPILSIVGIFVAGYLSFVEVTETEAVCGPIGDCNSVQSSPYAHLFGILPIGILGLMGYVAILLGWVLKKYGPESWRDSLTILIWGMAFFGVVFSIYLTYLEPFVIGATCMWCISSAIIITMQFWAASEPVRRIWMDTEDDFEE